ncbi:hypothetical protein LAZ67_4002895 [Cordylochernes scorpioides]|uniref:Thioredoxin domain-containing protein n=1 Tax=Cordylochernes scorpioides TaxID=51811 RepID=A0ABY6KEF0_9ARAC|nr:hypothetical protein LAZ67_4002895 [Cordylochernes scorpioides]
MDELAVVSIWLIHLSNFMVLEKIVSTTPALCKLCPRVLDQLEQIYDEAAELEVIVVKMDDPKVAKEYGIRSFPALLFFKKGGEGSPHRYLGSNIIEEVNGSELKSGECVNFRQVLEDLENIDDDCERREVKFIKTPETVAAAELGIKEFPVLVYFEEQVPNIYEGDLGAEEEVLSWLVHQKAEDPNETVYQDLLENLIMSTQYLAVLITKPNCRACDAALEELEKVDDETDLYGIYIVKLQDLDFAKRYGIKTYPALLYFRNGNPLIFGGDLKNEEAVLSGSLMRTTENWWIKLKASMPGWKKLVEESPFLAAIFYEEDCVECEKALAEVENIDDQTDNYGIDFVKISDHQAAAIWGIHTFPTLPFFRKQTPIVYEGDLSDEQAILKWMVSEEVFEIKDEIEENDCNRCEEALAELENINDEADSLDIMLVKIKDTRYARKYGINQMPALVYFRKKFPSIYRGDQKRSWNGSTAAVTSTLRSTSSCIACWASLWLSSSTLWPLDPYRIQGFMVWAGIFLGSRTALHIFRQDTLTGQRYRDEILEAYMVQGSYDGVRFLREVRGSAIGSTPHLLNG